MENTIDVSRELALAELKKETLGRSCVLAHAQASSVLLFTLQWKDLEDHLDKTMKSIEEKGAEVDLKLKLLEERERVVELKESELVSVRTIIEECGGELESKVKELGLVRISIEECKVELEGKEAKLGLVQARIEECDGELESKVKELGLVRNSSEECKVELEGKEAELGFVQARIKECDGELESKVKELGLVRISIEESKVALEAKEAELGLVQRRINECKVELKGKVKELGSVQKRIQESINEYKVREGELDVLRKSVLDWTEKLSVKKEELSAVEFLVEKFLGEIKERESLQKSIRDCKEQLELSKSQLSEIEKLIEVRKGEFDLEVNSLKTIVQEYREELAVKEHDFSEMQKSIEMRNTELECKRKELKLTEDRLAELHSQEKELELLQNDARWRIESKEAELNAVKGKVKKYSNDIELTEREFNALRKRTNERAQELSLTKKNLNSVQESLEKCIEELKVKEELVMAIEQSLVKCSEELELKKKHLSSVKNSVEELNDEHLSEELELVFVKTVTSQYLKELKEKEEHFNSFKNSVTKLFQDLEVKEAQFEERVKEFELKEKHFHSAQKTIEEQRKKLETQEKHLSSIHHPQVKTEQPESLGTREGVGRLCPNLESCIMGNGRILLLLMNEHLKKNDLFFCEISTAVKKAHDPAKLVLDAMQGFYPMHLQEKEGGFDVIIVRRSCILLLEHLLSFSPQITPQVRHAAMKLAGEWKAKMIVADHSLEVLGFLHLVAAFRLASDFNGYELQKLIDIVAPHKQRPELSYALGITDESPVKRILPSQVKTEQSERVPVSNKIDLLSAINERDLMPSEVSVALLVSPDPAKFVLDLIQGSYSENQKKGRTNMEEGVIRNYILLLEQLKDVLSKINPEVKAQATKLAVEWKSKMRVVTENSLVVLGFLQFLATYELVTSFDREEIIKLLFTVAQLKQAPEICRALGFADMAPDFVHNLIGKNQYLEAVRFICAFKLMDNISPEAVFKQYLDNVRTSASNMYKEGNNFLHTKDKAIDFEIDALRSLIECLQDCKLESLIESDQIRNCIVTLERQKVQLNDCVPVSSPMTAQQLQGKNCNFGSSALANQPPYRPMLQPQHGEKNHCSGASAGGSIQNCIVKLEKENTQLNHHIPAPFSFLTPQQLQGKNCNYGFSTPANQPASGPVFQQRQGEPNHSSSASGSGSGNQLYQQNLNKRPRTDPSDTRNPSNQPPYRPMLQPQHGEKNHCSGASAGGSIQNCIVKREKENTQLNHHIPAPFSFLTPQQLQGKNCNYGSSTPANQPASGPMFQQQQGEPNHSSSASGSGSGNQLYQQNLNKRPWTDPSDTRNPSNQPPYRPMLQPQHGEKNHCSGASAGGSIQNCIVKPEKENTQLNHHIPAPFSFLTPPQQQGKNCNFGSSTPANQPASGPMFQQQQGEPNHSSSASGSGFGNQLYQQNSNKCPRTDPSDTRNPSTGSPGGWHRPGIPANKGQGVHQATTGCVANQASTAAWQTNVSGNQYPQYFQRKHN